MESNLVGPEPPPEEPSEYDTMDVAMLKEVTQMQQGLGRRL